MSKKIVCPECGSSYVHIIDDAPGGTRKTLDLNPLHPFTVVKEKKKEKKKVSKKKLLLGAMTGGASLAVTGVRSKVGVEWHCQNCGNVWYQKK